LIAEAPTSGRKSSPPSPAHAEARSAFCIAILLVLLALPWPRWPVRSGPIPAAVEGPARLLFGLRLDPNHAESASLEALPAIGPARAAAIVAARLDRPFCSVDELTRVFGIGPATLARIAASLEVEPPAACRAPDRAGGEGYLPAAPGFSGSGAE